MELAGEAEASLAKGFGRTVEEPAMGREIGARLQQALRDGLGAADASLAQVLREAGRSDEGETTDAVSSPDPRSD